jgi:hypothetical protein
MTSFVVFLQIGFCCCPALLLIGYLLLVLDPTLVRFSIVSSFMPPVLVQILNAVLFLVNLFCWWGSMMECML